MSNKDKRLLYLDIEVTEEGGTFYRDGSKKAQYLRNGYPTIKYKNKAYRVHRLVAEKYIPNPDNLPFVNHKDGNKVNNCVDNLEWCTQRQNVHHALRTGLHPLEEVPVEGVCPSTNKVYWFESQAEAGRSTKALQPNINKCLSGLRKTAGGLKWRYANGS